MENTNEQYWEVVKLFDKLSNYNQVRFINNMIDIKTKRLEAERIEHGFLKEIINE